MRIALLSLAVLMIATTGLTACERTMSYDEATGQKDISTTKDWQYQKPWDRNNNSN